MTEAHAGSGRASSGQVRELPPLRRSLVEMSLSPDEAFNIPAASLDPERIAAAQELFAERVQQIPLLAKRAADAASKQSARATTLSRCCSRTRCTNPIRRRFSPRGAGMRC